MNEYTYRTLRSYAMEPLRQYLDTPAIHANDSLRRAMYGAAWHLKRDLDEAMELLKCTDLTPGEFAAAHLLAVISNARAIAWWREPDAPGERQLPLSTSEQKALATETRQAVAQFVAHVPKAQRAALLALIDDIGPQDKGVQAAAPLVHRMRADLLTGPIKQAKRQAENPSDANQVFAILRGMAKAKNAPFLGCTEEGLQWVDAQDKLKILSLDALRKRLSRNTESARQAPLTAA